MDDMSQHQRPWIEKTPVSAPGRDDADLMKNISVLYVEDDADIRRHLSEFLRRRVGKLYIAENGREGLELWRQHRPEVVVTDIMMPVMGGLKMAELIQRENPSVPIIVTTALNETESFLKAIDLGIDKYVIKPINTELLLHAIQKSAWGARPAWRFSLPPRYSMRRRMPFLSRTAITALFRSMRPFARLPAIPHRR